MYVVLVDWKKKLQTFSCEDIIKFLRASGVERVVANFEEYSVNGELLVQALENETIFNELTSNQLIKAKIRNKIEDYVLNN